MKNHLAQLHIKPIAILLITFIGFGGCSDDLSSLNAFIEQLKQQIAELRKPSKEEKAAELAHLKAQVTSLEKELAGTAKQHSNDNKPKVQSTTGASAYGLLTFNGGIITQAERARFWFLNQDSNTVPEPRVDYNAGGFSVFGLPSGHYMVEATLYLKLQTQACGLGPPLLPGNMTGSARFTVPENGGTEVNIELAKLIHMTKPEDNANFVHGGNCGTVKTFPKPLGLAWEPVMEDSIYFYRITTADCEPFKVNNPPVIANQTQATSVSLPLQPSKPGQIYILNLTALKNGKQIGTLETYGKNMRSWDYRFRIEGQ